jgi:DNA-binding XRE family transcriptional regulator
MKLTKRKVTAIKAMLAAGMSQTKVAKKYGVSRGTIYDIKTGRIWKDGDKPSVTTATEGAIDPTDERVLELEAMVEHLKTEKSFASRKLKATAKEHGLFKAIANELETIVTPISPLPPANRPRTAGKVEEHLVMHLSDGHHDNIVLPTDCGGLETYNFPISMRRAEEYVDTVIQWSQRTLKDSFTFPTLTVFAYGDHTSGEIHGAVHRSQFKNQFKNTFAIGQLHALMFRDLAPYFDTVNVIYVPGNHGRRSAKKNYHGAHDNWDYMVAEVARMHCADLENVCFEIPDTFTINVDIAGVGFCIFHGDDIKSSMGIPWYGLQRKQNRVCALQTVQHGIPIKYYCCGHFHRPATISELNGELFVNGAWIASDAYVYNSFAGYTEPTQFFHAVNPRRKRVTWRLPVTLKTPNEKRGPQRYRIKLANEVIG